jgi:diadenosine tetraphosphatase ApaH/serine/threonine PP2A family protein phosphatase
VRTALISDVHSNLAALEAVLEDLGRQGVDRIVCLGDIIGYGPNPVQCVDLVAQRCQWSLLGNHDFGVVYEPSNVNAVAEDAAFWTRRELERHMRDDPAAGVRRWDFLNRLRVRVVEGDFLCVHGSPRKPINEYLFPTDPENDPQKLDSVFERIDRVCLVGHTHVPGVFTDDSEFWPPDELPDRTYVVRPEEKAIVNPGSVGQPRDGDPRASYAILDTGPDGKQPTVRFHRVNYDIQLTVDQIHAIPELHPMLGDRLLEGR